MVSDSSSSNTSLSKKYGHKIIPFDSLANAFPAEKRANTIVLCHGVFDLVHPGHLRHLIFAKSKADILICSVTPDAFINKGIYRPHFSQNTRALNLAALEIVDFVVIDKNPTPIELLGELRPNLFAKGHEYGALENPRTKDEIEVLNKFSGEILFTPGDFVYSSTNLISRDTNKYLSLGIKDTLDVENIQPNQIHQCLEKFLGIRVLVIGDTIVDEIVKCQSIGGQTKTPTLSVREQEKLQFLGGAAIVSAHLAAAGADVKFVSVVGKDEEAAFVEKELLKLGIKADLIEDRTRPTTRKRVYEASGYRLLKVDNLDNRQIDNNVTEKIEENILLGEYEIVIFSDFRHGVFNLKNIEYWSTLIPSSKLKVADSQVASRWGNITDFKEFDLITPNEREARFSLGDQDSTVVNLGLRVREKSKARNVFLKLGDKGLLALDSQASTSSGIFPVPSITKTLVDAVGAGDALLSYGALALYASQDIRVAAIVGSIAASIACENEGNNPISHKSVKEKIGEVI